MVLSSFVLYVRELEFGCEVEADFWEIGLRHLE